MKEFLANFKEAKYDLRSGLVVFLVALPLCLGIALASGAPLFSGLITGIVGGIVVGSLSGSRFSVSGPAAGLTVIVLNAISDLGSFEIFLSAVVMAGIIQLIMGFLQAGIIGMYFPNSVIKGMLAAIGLILILKEIPHFFGFDEDAFGEMSFMGTDGRNTFQEFQYALEHIALGAFVAGAIALAAIVVWDKLIAKKVKSLKVIPGPLVGVVLGILMNELFKAFKPEWAITASHLVSLPVLSDPEMLNNSIHFPDFARIFSPTVIKTAFVIAIIASLETLLSLEAIDKLDPHKNHSPKNRELRAQGVGNIITGMLGGLPMTSVIIRSSANIDSGARTRMSAIYHGLMLLLAILFVPHILNMIPLSALAAVLLVIGFKLTKPALYVTQFNNGYKQFLPFIVTILAILFTDLLIGISIGMAVGIFFILRDNYKTAYFYDEEIHSERGHKVVTIILSEHVSFLNKASLLKALEEVPAGSELIIDGHRAHEIDFDAMVLIREFQQTALEKNIDLRLENFRSEFNQYFGIKKKRLQPKLAPDMNL